MRPGRGRSRVRDERRAAGERRHQAHVPPYQAAQIVLLRLDRERGGPGQHPASEVHAAAQVQVLGPADGSRRGQGARIHNLRHGSGESRSSPTRTPTLSSQTTQLSARGGRREVKKRRGFAVPFGKVSFLDSEKRGVRRAWNSKFRDAERRALCSLGMCVGRCGER